MEHESATRRAEQILEQFQITEPPVDPEMIAEHLGVDVVYADFPPDVSESVSGLIDFLRGAEKKHHEARIFVNSELIPEEKNFTIAHELGHFLLHKEYAEGSKYEVLLRSSPFNKKNEREQEADIFAAALLAPKGIVDKYRKIASDQELKQIFVVPDWLLKK